MKKVLLLATVLFSNAVHAQDVKKFFTAAHDNKAKTLQQMIDADFDVNTQLPKSKRTALLEAATKASKDAITVLLAAGADPNLDDTARLTPLIQVVKSYTLHKKDKDTFLIVSMLLNSGAHVDAQDGKGMTALMYAATFGIGPVVKLLVDTGADGTLKNILGDTAMDLVDPKGKYAKQIETWLLQAEFTKVGPGG